ncbi:hypothetical protein HOLleu_00211 [Holothuria leucospilota]|uniref:Uncharacterized protein n=1 Tax=Holothuria leucospilota TaxID=206669 RepID=A0A9Q1HK36_HOLLE|nr:hypothetical protein HOLleu_00211 [Holothuria leucospilota]
MHVLVNHVPNALRLHGNIEHFSQQGLEKLNDNVTACFIRSSSQIKMEAFREVMQKQNRIHHLAISCQRENVTVSCSICKNSGHNKRTCHGDRP